MIQPSTKSIPRLQIIRDRAIAQGLEKGLAKGLAKGREQGIPQDVEQGISQGVAKGILEGEVRALFKLLTARGLRPTQAQRQQILSCTDAAQLEQWIERAATAGSVSAVLGPSPRRAAPRAREAKRT